MILSLVFLASCNDKVKLTPHVPDFQLEEVRKYNTLSKKNSDPGNNPKLLPLEAVDGMYCFPKEEIAVVIDEWRKQNEMATNNLDMANEPRTK